MLIPIASFLQFNRQNDLLFFSGESHYKPSDFNTRQTSSTFTFNTIHQSKFSKKEMLAIDTLKVSMLLMKNMLNV